MMFKPLSKRRRHPMEVIRKSPLRSLVEELKLWKDRVFIVWVAGITSVMFGYYIPYVHLVSYAKDVGVPPDKGSMLVMILGGSTAVGRIMFGKIVQFGFLNRLHLHQMSMVITGTGAMLLPLITSFGGLAAYVVCVGLVDGCFVVLLPLMTAALVGSDKTVIAWGFLVGASSVTFTLGPPVAGWMYDYTGSYKLAFHVAGVPIVLGALILFLIPWAQRTSTSSNVLKSIKTPGPTEQCEGSTGQSPATSPLSSPMCGTHPTSAPLRNDSACFSNASVSSTKNVSITLTNILGSGYQQFTNAGADDENATASTGGPQTSVPPRALSKLRGSPEEAASLPANLNVHSATDRVLSETHAPGSSAEASSLTSGTSSPKLRKDLFERQKRLMLAAGRVRAKSWSESAQKYRDAVHIPLATKSERHRDLISFEARSQLTVDNADKAQSLGRRLGAGSYRRTSSSDMTLEGVTSSISSDANYQADVSQQESEESLVNMFDSFGMSQFGNPLTRSRTQSQSSGILQVHSVPADQQTSTSNAASPSPTDVNNVSPIESLLTQPPGVISLDSDTASSSQLVKPPRVVSSLSPSRSSTDKLPTITEHKPFPISDSPDTMDGDSDTIAELVQIALISTGAEG